MKIDLKQLNAFIVVAETGSLAGARDRLHLTQSAISMQLRVLQHTVGVALFTRTGRGLRLTEEGERLLEQAHQTISAANLFEKTANSLALPLSTTQIEPLSIGTILDPDFIRLGDFLRTVVTLLPSYRTDLRHGISGWVLQEVKEMRLDFGFYLGEADPDLFHLLPLTQVHYVVVAPRGWGAQLKGRDWQSLAALPWVWTPTTSVHYRLLNPLFTRLGITPHIVARVDQEASMLDLVRAGVGLSLAREAVALREVDRSDLVISREHYVQTKLSAVALRSRENEPAIKTLFEVSEAVWHLNKYY